MKPSIPRRLLHSGTVMGAGKTWPGLPLEKPDGFTDWPIMTKFSTLTTSARKWPVTASFIYYCPTVATNDEGETSMVSLLSTRQNSQPLG